MRYYSDKLLKLFDTEEELVKAELADTARRAKAEKEAAMRKEREAAEAKRKSDERAKRAKEVEDAFAAMKLATKKYNDLLAAFIKDYKSFHMTFFDNDFTFNWPF